MRHWNYILTTDNYEYEEEPDVILCESLEEAKERGKAWYKLDGSRDMVIIDIITEKVIMRGYIPEPSFCWEIED